MASSLHYERECIYQYCYLFVFLALQPCGCIFHSPVAGFSLLILEVS